MQDRLTGVGRNLQFGDLKTYRAEVWMLLNVRRALADGLRYTRLAGQSSAAPCVRRDRISRSTLYVRPSNTHAKFVYPIYHLGACSPTDLPTVKVIR